MYNLRIVSADSMWQIHTSEIESTFDLSYKFKVWDILMINVEKNEIETEIIDIEKV